MNIQKIRNGGSLTLVLEGWLDAITYTVLDDIVENELDGVTELVMDFKDVEYLTSAGLRVLLSAQQIMEDQGSFVIENVNQEVMEVLEMTGFIDIITVQ